MKIKSVNKLFTLIIYYLLTKHSFITTLHFVNKNIRVESDSKGCKSPYEPVLRSYIRLPYRYFTFTVTFFH
jgi:hypothetical protein